MWQNIIDIFSNQTLQELTGYLFWFIQSTRQCLAVIKRYEEKHKKRYKTRRYYLPKGVNKNYNVIINRKNLYDLSIDSDIKRYKYIWKLLTGQGKDYTTTGYFIINTSKIITD